MKGIILAGGKGSRLFPMTKVISKQLLPIYDKPMIYYPLSVLLLAKIKEILIISSPSDLIQYQSLLRSGENIGVNIKYKVQKTPRGLVDAFILGAEFIEDDNVCLILGDNVFFGQDLTDKLDDAIKNKIGATIFGYRTNNLSSFGVVEFDEYGKALSVEEKPLKPKSKFAVPGLYFYDNKVVNIAKTIKPSVRGEIEITDLNNVYLKMGELNVVQMGRGMAWFDTGTPEGILQAAEFVNTIQNRQGFYIACIEEIAWRRGLINSSKLKSIGSELSATEYGQYLLSLLDESTYRQQ